MKKLMFFALSLVLFSCKGNGVGKYIEQWQGQEITFSKDVSFSVYGVDTLKENIEWTNAKMKIFVYVDSLGCVSCKLRLRELSLFEDYLRSDLKKNIPVLLYFENGDVSSVSTLLKTNGYKTPVCIDTKGELSSRHEFSKNLTHNAFLLDSLNRVILVGYPMHNKDIEKMYIDEILRRSSGG